jgi:hypothetical protein
VTALSARNIAFAIAALGAVGTLIGWSSEPAAYAYAWLAAFTAWLGWPLGCLGLLFIHALTGGRWGLLLRPIWASGIRTLWLVIPAALPLFFVLSHLYPWTHSSFPNSFYLNTPFFLLRCSIYAAVWLLLSFLAVRAMRAGAHSLARLAPFALILLALTITFSAIDLTMSLDPRFNSSVYGLITMSEMALLALSVSTLIHCLSNRAPEAAMGKLLLGLTLLWAYLDFMQLLIVWQSDLATEAPWYFIRTTGGWGTTAALISLGHFALPLCLLIFTPIRRSPRAIAFVATLLIVSELVRNWWLVLPASDAGFAPVDVAAMACLLGIGAALALHAGARRD